MRTLLIAIIGGLLAAGPVQAQDASQQAFEHAFYLERAKRDYEGAVEGYRTALDGFRKQGAAARSQTCRIRLASCLLQLGRTDEAQAVLKSVEQDSAAEKPARVPVKPDTRPTWRKAIAEKLSATKLPLDFTDTPIDQVLEFLGEATGIPFVLDRRALPVGEVPKVTLRVSSLAVHRALQLITSLNKLEYGVRCGCVLVTTPGRLAMLPAEGVPESARAADRAVWDRLSKRRVDIDLEGGPIGPTLARLARELDVKITSDETVGKRKVWLTARSLAGHHAVSLLAALAGCVASSVKDEMVVAPRLWAATSASFESSRKRRAALLRLGGGTAATQKAVSAGLGWLAKRQKEDGRWAGRDHGAKMGWVDPGLTGLATLAFLGAGHAEAKSPLAKVVERALTWLQRNQDDDGLFGVRRGHFMYNHLICTLAVVEAYGLRGGDELRLAATRGVRAVLSARNPGMAWRYGIRDGDNDVSVTGWAVQVLTAAKMARLDVKGIDRALEDAAKYITLLTEQTNHITGYRRRRPKGWTGPTSSRFVSPDLGVNTARSHAPNHTPTAIGILTRRLTGAPETDAGLRRAAARIADLPPAWQGAGARSSPIDYYYWYYGSMALFQLGGKSWERWNARLVPTLVNNQKDDGSWDTGSAWAFAGGRVYTTAINTLTLQTYYRYPQIAR